MFPARFQSALLAAAVVLGGFCESAWAQTTETRVLSSQILPKDTYLHLSMPSVTGFREAFEASSAGKLWADPALDEFKAEVTNALGSSEIQEGFAKVHEALGLTVEELCNIPTGEVSIAFSKASNKMGLVLYLDFGSHESEVTGLLEKATNALKNVPDLEPASIEHDGTELVMFNVKAPAAKATPLAKEFGWFVKGERLVASNSSAMLKLILDNWDGSGEKTLASNETYSYIMEKCGSADGARLMTTYVDPVGMVTQLVQTGSLGEAGLQAGVGIGFLPMLGLNQLKGMGSVGEMGGEGVESVQRSFIYTEQPPQALMQVFQLGVVEQTPPSWVKDNASIWMSTQWKIEEAFNAVQTLVDSFQGEGTLAGLIENLASQGPQVHIKTDVIDQLDGKIQVIMAPGDPQSENQSDDILIALGVRETEKVADLLVKLTADNFPGETRELEGATIYEIEQPGGPGKFGFTVANNQLLIGVGGMQLEQAIRNADDLKPLAESDDFKAVAEYYPDGALMVSFVRPAEQYQRLYEMLRSGDAAENFPGMDEVFAMIDFSKLPPFEVVRKYLAPAGSYWVGDDNGVMMQQYSLTPQE